MRSNFNRENLKRVNWNDICLSDEFENYLVYYHGEELFTGLSESFSTDGSLLEESEFHDGFIEGISKEWHPNGILTEISTYWRNRWHGFGWGWNEEGFLNWWSLMEFDITISDYKWDDDGKLIEEYHLTDKQNPTTKDIIFGRWDDIEMWREVYKTQRNYSAVIGLDWNWGLLY